MADSGSHNTDKRLDRLEQQIEKLTGSVDKLFSLLGSAAKTEHVGEPKETPRPALPQPQTAEKREATPTPKPPAEAILVREMTRPPDPPRKKPAAFQFPDKMKSGEYWLNRIGIGLLLFGIIFLFKFSIDNGWLTPWIRIAFGLGAGTIALFLGYRIYNKRQAFATSLLGLGFGIWYITGFSAYQLLGLVSHTTAFGFMIAVTVSAFILSLKQDDALLSLIAVLGGLGTPFMLYSSSGNLPALILYTSLIVACGLGIFFFKGWRSILWLTNYGGWIVFLIAVMSGYPEFRSDDNFTRWAIQSGLWFGWLGFWLVPIFREMIHLKNPDKWPRTFVGFGESKLNQTTKDIIDKHLHMMVVLPILVGLGLSSLVWERVISTDSWASICFGLSAIYFFVSYQLRSRPEFKTLKYTHLLVAISLFNLALVLLLDGNTLLFSLASEAAILRLLANRLNDKAVSVVAHILHGVSLGWLLTRLTSTALFYPSDSFFDGHTLTDLWVIFTLAIAAIKLEERDPSRIYGIAAIGTLAALFIQELSGGLELFAVTTEALFVYGLYIISRNKTYAAASHLLFGIVAALMALHFLEVTHRPEYGLNLLTLSNLWSLLAGLIIFGIEDDRNVKRAYLLGIAVGLATIIIREFRTDMEFVLLTLESAFLLYFFKAAKDKFIQYIPHIFFGMLALSLTSRFINTPSELSGLVVLNWAALSNLLYIVVVAFVSKYILDKDIQFAYRFAAHIATLSFLGFELSRLDNGQGWVSISWGLYGITLLLIGLRMNIGRFRIVGLGTLLLLVGKLFLVDLSKLETIWRILLFIGFGGIFLLLSYYFRSLWKTDGTDVEEDLHE